MKKTNRILITGIIILFIGTTISSSLDASHKNCSEKEIIQLSNRGYDCQFIGHEKCLMRKKVMGQTGS